MPDSSWTAQLYVVTFKNAKTLNVLAVSLDDALAVARERLGADAPAVSRAELLCEVHAVQRGVL